MEMFLMGAHFFANLFVFRMFAKVDLGLAIHDLSPQNLESQRSPSYFDTF